MESYGGFVICAKPHTNGNDRETLNVNSELDWIKHVLMLVTVKSQRKKET